MGVVIIFIILLVFGILGSNSNIAGYFSIIAMVLYTIYLEFRISQQESKIEHLKFKIDNILIKLSNM